jgi:fructose-1-phosphate kinase PfkB-like protein
MKPVVTLTLNPTIDKSTSVEKLLPEHKLSCVSPIYEPGGGGINVSRGLKRLGTDSVALFPFLRHPATATPDAGKHNTSSNSGATVDA